MTTPTEHGLKPRDQWDSDDWADFQDGWHQASDLGFKSPRDANREVLIFGPLDTETAKRPVIGGHLAGALQASGRTARERHREATAR